jgi:hypothetical protein
MMRRLLLLTCLIVTGVGNAVDLSGITKGDATAALRSALTQGAVKAVGELGQTDGFLLNPEVKIPLPPHLQNTERVMRRFGFGSMADELITTMNRAAEAAVPEAKTLLVGAVKSMTVADAKAILAGGNDSATQYFRSKTQTALAQKFKPIVAQATHQAGVAESYNSLAGKVAQFGLIDAQSANIDDYITAQALDGLYKMIAKEELAIRSDPIGQSSKLLQRVFGAVTGQ